jgi:protein gp37
MGDKSAIEWTDATWNPVTGCTKLSPGCKHCYAERLAGRLQAMGNPRYRNGFGLHYILISSICRLGGNNRGAFSSIA